MKNVIMVGAGVSDCRLSIGFLPQYSKLVAAHRELYGTPLENREIIHKEPPVPKAAKKLISLLNKYSSRETR